MNPDEGAGVPDVNRAKVVALIQIQAELEEENARLKRLASEALRACYHLAERLLVSQHTYDVP